MKAFLEKIAQSLGHEAAPLIVAAMAGYYAGIYNLKSEMYALHKKDADQSAEIATLKTQLESQNAKIELYREYMERFIYPFQDRLDKVESEANDIDNNIRDIERNSAFHSNPNGGKLANSK